MSKQKAKAKEFEITEEETVAVDDQSEFAIAATEEILAEIAIEQGGEAIHTEEIQAAPTVQEEAGSVRILSNSLIELTVAGNMYRVTREGRTFNCGSTSARSLPELAAKLKAKQ